MYFDDTQIKVGCWLKKKKAKTLKSASFWSAASLGDYTQELNNFFANLKKNDRFDF